VVEVVEVVEVIEARQRRSLDHLDDLDTLDYLLTESRTLNLPIPGVEAAILTIHLPIHAGVKLV
jgi:hypothetical protein